MIRAIIVEDEELVLQDIRTMVEETGLIDVVKTYANAKDALKEAAVLRPQLAFIDIELPGMDGITLAENLLEAVPALRVVFITAYNEYAVKAFELNAVDYLLKPIGRERFAMMVGRIASSLPRVSNRQEQLEIDCFGVMGVRIGGKAVRWGRSKAEELFCYLLIHHKTAVHKEAIIEELWPDYDVHRALPILQTAACQLRNVFSPLQGAVKLEYAASRYCLTVAQGKCDYFFVLDVLEREFAADTYAAMTEAAQLISRGFFKDQGYLWAVGKEEELKSRMYALLRSHAEHWLSLTDCHSAIRPLKLLLDILPYDETGNNQLLECYARLNDGTGIVEHYRWLVKVLREEYDMEPAVSTRELYKKLYGERFS